MLTQLAAYRVTRPARGLVLVPIPDGTPWQEAMQSALRGQAATWGGAANLPVPWTDNLLERAEFLGPRAGHRLRPARRAATARALTLRRGTTDGQPTSRPTSRAQPRAAQPPTTARPSRRSRATAAAHPRDRTHTTTNPATALTAHTPRAS